MSDAMNAEMLRTREIIPQTAGQLKRLIEVTEKLRDDAIAQWHKHNSPAVLENVGQLNQGIIDAAQCLRYMAENWNYAQTRVSGASSDADIVITQLEEELSAVKAERNEHLKFREQYRAEVERLQADNERLSEEGPVVYTPEATNATMKHLEEQNASLGKQLAEALVKIDEWKDYGNPQKSRVEELEKQHVELEEEHKSAIAGCAALEEQNTQLTERVHEEANARVQTRLDSEQALTKANERIQQLEQELKSVASHSRDNVGYWKEKASGLEQEANASDARLAELLSQLQTVTE